MDRFSTDPDDEHAISRAATENLHFVWIHSDVWKLLTSFYEGGPAFERKVYERSGANAWVCWLYKYDNIDWSFCSILIHFCQAYDRLHYRQV